MTAGTRYTGLIERYRDRLPVGADTRIISLGEGDTPLIKLENIPRTLGREVEIYVKFEGLNPTGSFKDRGMTMAVTQAVSEGAEAIICASTGNTSASAAAYAARAGIRAFVLIPGGKIALGKLAQAMIQGAVVIQIQGNFDDGMRIVKEMAEVAPVTIVNSINPYSIATPMIQNQAMLGVLSAHPSYLNAYAPMPYQPVVGGEAKRSDFMSPEEAAEVVAWLAGDNSGVVSGSQILVDRGVLKY